MSSAQNFDQYMRSILRIHGRRNGLIRICRDHYGSTGFEPYMVTSDFFRAVLDEIDCNQAEECRSVAEERATACAAHFEENSK